LRRRAFVEEQGLFAGDDGDEHEGAAHTVVLVAVAADGVVLGGVRLHPEGDDAGLGWWRGRRLVCSPAAGAARGRFEALVASTKAALGVPGLYLVGLPWLHTWGSGRFSGIARDAEYLADLVVAPRALAALGRG